MYKDAYIDGDYRYWLSRYWDDNKDVVGWIMLNPSTADHKTDDPTIRGNYENKKMVRSSSL